ncbi:MAG: arginine--tRNA ligase [Leptospiraceae bacterium]|nr:arginine--tRNA ligase [Leptospiraceae bacterium]
MKLLKDLVSDLFSSALSDIAGQELEARVEYAREEKFGDYACTSALDQRIREACGVKNPRELAQQVVDKLQNTRISLEADVRKPGNTIELSGQDCFVNVDIAGPGFINVKLRDSFLMLMLSQILQSGASYGQSQSKRQRKIIFEFVSANPTGPLNVVSARAAALGDSCCNLLEAAGHKVYREYYVNDYGNQVFLLGISCVLRLMELKGAALQFSQKGKDGPVYASEPGLRFPDQGYHGQYLVDVLQSLLEKNSDLQPPADLEKELLERSAGLCGDSATLLEELGGLDYAEQLGRSVTEFLRSSHERDLQEFRVRFDNFYSERSLHESGEVMSVLDSLGDHIFEEDGKKLFRSTEFGDDKDRVVVRDDGRPTYLLADIAYHKSKIDRGHEEIIDIWGPDHHGYIARLKGAMQALGFPDDRFRVLIAQQVNLLSNGEPVVMSKRTGQFVTLKELIEEIPLDVVRYFFVMRSFESHLDFDLVEARDTSDKNPYYYVGYAHARVRSIFRRCIEEGIIEDEESLMKEACEPPPGGNSLTEKLPPLLAAELDSIGSPERRRLIWLASRFPEEIRDAAEAYEPHRLIQTLYQIAQALSRFYGVPENKVLTREKSEARFLLCILESVALCLRNGLALLGMQAPERMSRDESVES